MSDKEKYEYHRVQLAASLSAVAESMRNCANMAEHFATIVKQTSFSPDSPAMHMIHAEFSGEPQTPNTAAAGPPPTTGRKRKAAAIEVGEDGKKKRAPRKPKDPNAPKRPASSYIMFQNDIRKELKSKHPNIQNSELLAMIAKQWAEMTDDQKLVYTQAMASAKERYSADKKAYDSRTPEEIAAADAVTAAAAATKKATPRTRAPKAAAATPAAAPVVTKSEPVLAPGETSASSGSSDESSASEDSSEDEGQEAHEEDDDDGDEEEEDDEPAPKKAKKTPVTLTPVTHAHKEKKRKTTKA